MAKGLVLTQKNYFTPENTAISNSKVSDYLRSKEYYYKRHISHELQFTATTPVKIGRIVDAIVSQEKVPYDVKVLKRDDPDRFEQQKLMPDDAFVTESQWEEGQMRAQAITREPFYQEYLQKGAKFQVILQGEIFSGKLGEVPVCGMADVVLETDDTIFIDDCKSVSPMKIKTLQHWYWNCRDMGYFRQMGAYSMLMEYMRVAAKLPEKKIVCRHFVVTKEMDGLYKVRLFILPEWEVSKGRHEFTNGVLGIASEKDWIDPPLSWQDAELLFVVPDKQEEDYDDEEEGFE